MIGRGRSGTTPLLLALAVATGMLLGLSGFTFWYGKGYSYLSEDPGACLNCHVMKENFDSWQVSAHRDIPCDDCHLPHDLVGRYLAKAEHGIRHTVAFTFADVQVLRATPKSYHDLQGNCISCHERTVAFIVGNGPDGVVSCTRCHQGAGHVL